MLSIIIHNRLLSKDKCMWLKNIFYINRFDSCVCYYSLIHTWQEQKMKKKKLTKCQKHVYIPTCIYLLERKDEILFSFHNRYKLTNKFIHCLLYLLNFIVSVEKDYFDTKYIYEWLYSFNMSIKDCHNNLNVMRCGNIFNGLLIYSL